jgi:cation diffusion facilitator family transporter
MAASSSSKTVVYAALFGNLLVALTKFGAAWWTGSSAMLSEAIHSVVDTSNQILLLYGIHRAAKPPDRNHPLGHGRELYFWSFVVALLMFTLGAGATLYEGVSHIAHPAEIVDAKVNYIVLAFSALFEGATWLIALRAFGKAKGDLGYFEALRRSKDPPTFIVLFEDSAALLGLGIAFLGTLAAEWFAMPVLDGVAAIGISLVLAVTAIALARESKGLLIGEPASPRIREGILEIARKEPGIERAHLVFTVHLAPDQIVVALSLEFADTLTTTAIEEKVAALERRIREALPQVMAIFVKPQSLGTYQSARRHLRTDAAGVNASTDKSAAPSDR